MYDTLTKILAAYEDLEAKLGDPAVLADQKEYTRLAKEHEMCIRDRSWRSLVGSRMFGYASPTISHQSRTPRSAGTTDYATCCGFTLISRTLKRSGN